MIGQKGVIFLINHVPQGLSIQVMEFLHNIPHHLKHVEPHMDDDMLREGNPLRKIYRAIILWLELIIDQEYNQWKHFNKYNSFVR